MNKIKIPHSFQILGHTVSIVWDENRLDDLNAVGLAEVTLDKITLTKKSDGKTLTSDTIEHTYLHELVHTILKSMGENELYKNERFVDLFAGMLHQILKTSKY